MTGEIEELIKQLEKSPQTIGRNTVIRKVGEGAFAYVFECTFDKFGRKKGALKLPKSKESEEDIETRKIILSALGDSPFSTNVIDEGTLNGAPYIVEEYRETTLAKIIEDMQSKKQTPTPKDIIDLGTQLLQGIDYFHRLKQTNPVAAEKLGIEYLTHCDIKPSNILQARDLRTNAPLWEYTDFGIRINKETTDQQKPQISLVCSASLQSIRNKDATGKSNPNLYASPEVRSALILEQTPPATATSDLWSIGAVLFAYATGRAPEWGEDTPERTDLPEEIKIFFKKILNGNPAKRYQTAKEAMAGLERKINNEIDSYIIGYGQTEDGKYQVFKQPMSKGKPAGELSVINYSEKIQKMIYIPELKKTVIISDNGTDVFATIKNARFETTTHQNLTANPDIFVQKLLDYDVQIVKNNKEFLIRIEYHDLSLLKNIERRTKKCARHGTLNLLTLYCDEEKFNETKPGWFSKWKKCSESANYDGPKVHYEKQQEIKNKEGRTYLVSSTVPRIVTEDGKIKIQERHTQTYLNGDIHPELIYSSPHNLFENYSLDNIIFITWVK